VISQPKEGVVIDYSEVADVIKICSEFYDNKKFVYLSKRVHDFNVNPVAYYKLVNLRNLVGFGVVSRKASSLNMATFERNFSKVPFAIFLDIEKAQEWVESVLNK
jgi:hypothetical protein